MNSNFLISAFQKLRRRFRPEPSGTPEEALEEADLLQEAFLRLWTRIPNPDSEAHAEGLLLTTIRNLRIDNVRRRAAGASWTSDTPSPEPTAESEPSTDPTELYVRVTQTMDRLLSPRDREILFHREHDGWEFDELAAHYGLSEPNVRMIVARGRRKVYAALSNDRTGHQPTKKSRQ